MLELADARLQPQLDVCACVAVATGARQLECMVGRVPDLRDRKLEGLRLLVAPRHDRYLRLTPECVVEVDADPIELLLPGREGTAASPSASMSRMASASPLRSLWIRSSCSDAIRLRSVRSACRRCSPEIWRLTYHE